MIQRGKVAIQRIEDIGHVLRDEEHKLSQTKIGAGAAQVTGPLLYGLGIGMNSLMNTINSKFEAALFLVLHLKKNIESVAYN